MCMCNKINRYPQKPFTSSQKRNVTYFTICRRHFWFPYLRPLPPLAICLVRRLNVSFVSLQKYGTDRSEMERSMLNNMLFGIDSARSIHWMTSRSLGQINFPFHNLRISGVATATETLGEIIGNIWTMFANLSQQNYNLKNLYYRGNFSLSNDMTWSDCLLRFMWNFLVNSG